MTLLNGRADPNVQKKRKTSRSEYAVPDDLMIEVCNQIIEETGKPPAEWLTSERRMCRQKLGMAYGHVDEDTFSTRALYLWQKGLLEGKIKRRRNIPALETPPDDILEHYKSPQYRKISDDVLWRAENRCQLCNSEATECHHRTYTRIRTSEEENDLIAVCRTCHTHLDRWRKQAKDSSQ